MITACLIVRNEEQMLNKCLDSLMWIDEIIIVDTWSQDKTKEIALKYTDKVYDFTWIDDFSKARNFAKSKANNDWILSIDADEILETSIEYIKACIEQNESDWFMITLYNETETTTSACRLFKKELKWNWKIHEHILPKKPMSADIKIKFWVSPAHQLDPQRNLRILAKSYQEDPNDKRTLYYLARELFSLWQYEEAIDWLNQYRLQPNWFYDMELVDSYFLSALCYYKQWKNSECATMLWQVIVRNPYFKNAYMLLQKIDNKEIWNTIKEEADNRNLLVNINLDLLLS